MNDKTRSMYGISRIDDETHHTHAWRVSLRRRGKMHVKNFPDTKYGGKRKALRLAQRHRDDVVRRYPTLSRREFCNIVRRNNQSGVVGVCRRASGYRLKNGRMRYNWYWEAIWPTKLGEHETARFGVNKYGKEGAFQRACAARVQGLKRVKGAFWACRPGAQPRVSARGRRGS